MPYTFQSNKLRFFLIFFYLFFYLLFFFFAVSIAVFRVSVALPCIPFTPISTETFLKVLWLLPIESLPAILSTCLHCKNGKSLSKCVIWATSRENVSSGIFDKVRFKPAWSATEPSYNLETLDTASIYIKLSKQRKTKVLIRLRGRTGWSAPLLFAHGIRHVFAWPGPFDFFCRKICSCDRHAGW